MLTLKPDVRIFGLRPEIVLAILVAERAYAEIGCELMLTSGVEGTHSAGSLHYAGSAADFRTLNVAPDKLKPLVEKIRGALGAGFRCAPGIEPPPRGVPAEGAAMRRLAAILLLPLLAHAARPRSGTQPTRPSTACCSRASSPSQARTLITADGHTVHRWEQAYTIASGAISLDLEPNDTATPAGTSYLVRFTPANGVAWTERWIIPTSASPLKVHQVRVQTVPSPSLTVQPSQILGGGASDGQSLLWSQSNRRWQPGTVEAGVGSVFGRTGAVASQSGDYRGCRRHPACKRRWTGGLRRRTGTLRRTLRTSSRSRQQAQRQRDAERTAVLAHHRESGLDGRDLGFVEQDSPDQRKKWGLRSIRRKRPAGPPYMTLDIKPERQTPTRSSEYAS